MYNSVKKTLGEGYWTFTILKKEIDSYGTVSLEASQYDVTCSITSDNVMNLQNFGPIISFEQNKTISANTKTKSRSVKSS